jgi:hypothetical protein
LDADLEAKGAREEEIFGAGKLRIVADRRQGWLGGNFNDRRAGSLWRRKRETFTLHGAEAIATVRGGGCVEGQPVVKCNRHGGGWVIYAGCDSTGVDFLR